MICIEITAPGGPEVLKAAERPDPVPGPGEVLIRVAAAGVNRPDVLQRRGAYPPPPGASDIPGLEVAGTIAVVGDRCGGLARRRRRLRAGVRRRLRDDVRGACAAMSAGAGLARSRGGRGDSGDVLHGLDQRVRSRATAGGRDRALSRRLERHRHDRDPTRRCARRHRVCHRRIRREGRACEALGARRAINYRTEDFVEVDHAS